LRGYGKDGVVEQIRAAGGEIFAITSEPQSLATNAQTDWETGFVHVGDPHQEILDECKERGWLSLFTNDWGDDLVASGNNWMSHPKGYFQPGVLALSREGRVLYRWRCRPNRQNIGGAIARPTAPHVWSRVKDALHKPADSEDAPHDDTPELDATPVPWPVFVTLLIANGWFLRPVGFDQRPGEDTLRVRQRNALLRILLFLGAWIAAFVYLPLWLASLALAGWVAKIAPGVLRVNARFQNVRADEEPT
jgi:hypothetical protein